MPVNLNRIDIRLSEPPNPQDIDDDSKGFPVGLVPFHSGFTIAMVRKGAAGWTPEELAAFQDFVNELRMRELFRELFEEVQKAKQRIHDHGSWTAQVLA
ncbi:MAG: hypothetical protein ACREUU_06140, partial [Gammaproteobacteria bacterium]